MSIESPGSPPYHLFDIKNGDFWRPPNAEETDYGVAMLAILARSIASIAMDDFDHTDESFRFNFKTRDSPENKCYTLDCSKTLGGISRMFVVKTSFEYSGAADKIYLLNSDNRQSLDQRKNNFSLLFDSQDDSGINPNDLRSVVGCNGDKRNGWVNLVEQMPRMNLGRLNEMYSELTACKRDAESAV